MSAPRTRGPHPALAAVLIALCLGYCGQAGVEPISADWTPTGRRPIEVASASSSAFLGEQYAPAKIHDGDRRTKWVCPTRPTASAPQWIALELAGGGGKVTAVAVFGERIGNDGVLDADVQVLTDGGFATVASIRDATSPSWLATFDPVPTAQVRLLVSRSSGPTDHTDVWEMVVCGAPLTEAELKSELDAAVAVARRDLEFAEATLGKVFPTEAGFPEVLRDKLRRGRVDAQQAQAVLEQWSTLESNTRVSAVEHARAAATRARRLRERSERLAVQGLARRTAVETLHRDLRPQRGTPGLAHEANDRDATLSSDRLRLRVELETGQWSVAWGDDVPAAMSGVGFSAVVDGRRFADQRPQTTVRPARGPLGDGFEVFCVWETNGIRLERTLGLYEGCEAAIVGGRVVNTSDRPVRLGTFRLLEVTTNGWWQLGPPWEPPAAVYVQGHSLLRSTPFEPAVAEHEPLTQSYGSSGVLALVNREPRAALVLGYLRADEAAPDLAAGFRRDEGGMAMAATSRFLDRVLDPGEALELNRVYVATGTDPFRALENYGTAMARCSARPVRTGATSLWCSWYAHRMAMTEEKVLENAAVAARHFRPLGLEIMQLDHGWQRGDITGDWVPNERFPHGLKWLADELRSRHGLRLGLWIAPTDVAATSQLYQQHPEWMLEGPDGKPRVNWRWYWKPNPDCFELDATQPAARQFLVDTFARLSAEGASYYKIDFIASAGGEHFQQQDPKATRGWSNLRRAMEAIREGAGETAWIRYCQTPPILSAGLAHSAYGGDDTLDAGIPGRFDVLRDNAHALAAGYWLNDRAYHREVCDMSVRMQGSLEEVRVRAALMTLANCSISWSDELCYLPPSRIRLMQQCLPPGNPPMRPVDLFERDVPSLWHLRVTNAVETWDVVGVFNFNRQSEPRPVTFSRLGLDPDAEYAVFEFWESRFLGIRRGGIELTLPPESSRILALRRVTGVPQLLGTDLHVLAGYHEVREFAWDADRARLTGHYHRMPGLTGRAFILVPEGYYPKFEFPLSPGSARLTHVEGPVWMQEIEFREADYRFTLPFEPPPKREGKEPTG